MEILTLPVILAIAAFVVGGARLGFVLWRQAKLTAVETWLATNAARVKDAAAALLERYRQIDAAPPSDDPANDLNDEWNRRPKP